MAGRYFGIPFATTGDRITVPDATQPDGSVSFTQGFGFDYERPNTDPAYKPVPRDGTNGLFHDITEALGIAQRQGVSDWTVDAQPYPINALVRHTNKVWRSLVANNNVTPVEGASWTELSTVPQATEAVAGIIEIATTAEAQAGTNDTHALTPKKLRDATTSSATDTTAGRILKVGDWGIGGPRFVVNGNDLFADDNFTDFYGINLINAPTPPGTTSGWVQKMARSGGYRRVVFRPLTSSGTRIFENSFDPTTSTWFGWVELYNSGNLTQATETAAGLIEIATTAEAQALTDDTTALTPKKLADALDANVFGADQTWQDVTASRASGVNYTNSTGKPIMVSLSVGGGSVPNIEIHVDGVITFMNRNAFSSTTEVGCVGIVPAGSTYKAAIMGTLTYWKELR